jgi:hypothetical protein|tara:strand:+ start:1349 stop:1483 length:135 start_codon:yes stop_codon:yes gene_type:complete
MLVARMVRVEDIVSTQDIVTALMLNMPEKGSRKVTCHKYLTHPE